MTPPELPGGPHQENPEPKQDVYLPTSAVRHIIDTSPLLKTQKDNLHAAIDTQGERTGEKRSSIESLLSRVEDALGIEEPYDKLQKPTTQAPLSLPDNVHLIDRSRFEQTDAQGAPPPERQSLEERIEAIASKAETMADPAIVVRSVLEGLLDVRYVNLTTEEKRKISEELRRYGIESLDEDKI